MTEASPAWRSFEKLVARIEESLAPKGAIVTSPDRIRDLVTGKLREVDASIRFPAGSAEILVTIECRRRKGIQDDTWIEQLGAKRMKIGAAKTLAVSATGFTESAKKTAQLHGIELRSLRDRIEDELARQFLSGFKMSLLVVDYRPRHITFFLDTGEPLPPAEFSDDLRAALKTSMYTPIAIPVGHSDQLTINDILQTADDRDLPDDESTVSKEVAVEVRPGEYQVSTRTGPKPLRAVSIQADFRRRVVPAPASSFYEYADGDRAIRQIVQGDAQITPSRQVQLQVDLVPQPSRGRNAAVTGKKGGSRRKPRGST